MRIKFSGSDLFEVLRMPYQINQELPDSVKDNLPDHAQDIYRAAFNHAFQEYADPSKRRKGGTQEETAHRVAWSAVEEKYEKRDGKWVSKRNRAA